MAIIGSLPLDPNRYVWAVLADPSHRFPTPRGDFPAAGQLVDLNDPFIQSLLAGGSLRRGNPPALPAEPPKSLEPAKAGEAAKLGEPPRPAEPPSLTEPQKPVAPAPAAAK